MRKTSNINYFVALLFLLFVMYVVVYVLLMYPLYNLTLIQTKPEISEITKTLIIGKSHNEHLVRLAPSKVNKITFYYYYFTIDSPRYTIWVCSHLCNKFSDEAKVTVYYFDRQISKMTQESISFKFDDLKTSEQGNTLIMQLRDNYIQVIDQNLEWMTLHISVKNITLSMKMKIDNWTTTQPSLLNRYNYLSGAQLIETNSPGEWASDNPLIGKVTGGNLNGESFTGNAWFDNFIGCNNFFLSEYYWYYIQTDEWLIYILFYGEHDKINSPEMCKPLLIKDRVSDKVLHCSPGRYPSAFAFQNSLFPIHVDYRESPDMKWGNAKFDKYSLHFKSGEIEINVESIPGESVLALRYDYYRDSRTDTRSDKLSGWDKEYANVINNLEYIEYVNRVKLTVNYGGNITTSVVNQVIDAVVPKDRNMPSTIQY